MKSSISVPLTTVMVVSFTLFAVYKLTVRSVQSSKPATDISTNSTLFLNAYRGYESDAGVCNCKTLFTIGACGVESLRSENLKWNHVLQMLKTNRDNSRGYFKELHELSRYMKQTLQLTNFNVNKSVQENSGLIKDPHAPLPFVKCLEYVYDLENTERCLTSFRRQHKRPLSISFIGDSQTRYLMAHLLKFLEPIFKLTEEGRAKMHILYYEKIKYNMNLETEYLNATIYWSPYFKDFDDESVDTLNMFCSNEPSPLPDIIVLSSLTWYASFKGDFNGFDMFFSTLRTLHNCLARISAQIPVLWIIGIPTKQKLQKTENFDGMMAYLNGLAGRVLRDTNVWVWDSAPVVALREQAFCPSLMNSTEKFLTPLEWKCNDLFHPGLLYYMRAVNMIFNLLCNKINGYTDMCCT